MFQPNNNNSSSATNEEKEWLNKPNESSWADLFDSFEPSTLNLCLPSCPGTDCCCSCGTTSSSSNSTRCCGVSSVGSVALGHAFDLILLQSASDPASMACSHIHFSFDSLVGIPNCVLDQDTTTDVCLEVETTTKIRFPIKDGKFLSPQQQGIGPGEGIMKRGGAEEEEEEDGNSDKGELHHNSLALQKIAECCTFGEATGARVVIRRDGRIIAVAPCSIFFWSTADRLFICDIDGTITKSNLGGLWDSVVSRQYTYCHSGICQFLQSLVEEEEEEETRHSRSGGRIRILYLSSCTLELAFSTRTFLRKMRQPQRIISKPGLSIGLPLGPLLGFTQGLSKILVMELIKHNVYEFKTKALQEVANMWGRVAGNDRDGDDHPFFCGLGNTFMDARAYHTAGLTLDRIYIINKKSEINCLDRTPSSIDSPGMMDAADYKGARRTLFPFGYLDKNLVGHILSANGRETATAAETAASLV